MSIVKRITLSTEFGDFVIEENGEVEFSNEKSFWWYTSVNSCCHEDPNAQYSDFKSTIESDMSFFDFLSIRRKISALYYII
jgi:hypothetical protein